jgi:inward rectifier potassium channel
MRSEWKPIHALGKVRLAQGKFEVQKLGATRFDLREPYYIAVASSWPLFILLCLVFLAAAVSLFAGLYLIDPNALQGMPRRDFAHAFFFSLQVISTSGFENVTPHSLYGYVIAGLERVIGIAIIPVVTGLLFARFSRARPGIEFATAAVVTTRSGTPELRVRIANAKSTMLTGARASMSILLKEHDPSGEIWRRYHDLPLLRDHLPLFALTWTVMHPIDAASPLHGLTAADLKEAWASLVVTVEARDSRLGQKVENIAVYTAEDILFGKHYAAAISHDPDGATIADVTRLSEVEDDAPTGGGSSEDEPSA